jgi:hypothetical protein
MKEENVIFNNKGEKLAGVLHTPEAETKSAVVFCHGFAADKNDYRNKLVRAARKICTNGFSALRFDLQGCGASDGRFVDTTISTEAEDLRAAIDFIKGLGYERIGILGSSLGGFVSILANDSRIKCMALWSPVLSLKDTFLRTEKISQQMIAEAMTKGFTIYKKSDGREVELGKEFVKEVNSLEIFDIIKRINYPLLIVHGNKDETVDYRYSEKYIRYAAGQKKLLIIPGADHDFTTPDHEQQLTEATIEWFKVWLK